MGVKCFFMDQTIKATRSLRRYSPDSTCPLGYYHDAQVVLDVVEDKTDLYSRTEDAGSEFSGWPTTCKCGYSFTESDECQLFVQSLFRRADNGEMITLRDAPPGAMWYAKWMPENMYWDNKKDMDHLMVRLPDGTDWCVDSRANNCTLPDDRLHRCWVRSGIPPNVTVGKDGVTCSAGAGSIQSPKWHGYLRKGELVV
jgi:hypothetical protein